MLSNANNNTVFLRIELVKYLHIDALDEQCRIFRLVIEHIIDFFHEFIRLTRCCRDCHNMLSLPFLYILVSTVKHMHFSLILKSKIDEQIDKLSFFSCHDVNVVKFQMFLTDGAN